MKNPSYRTYLFLIFLFVALFAGWKACGRKTGNTPGGNVPVKVGSGK